MHRHWQVECQYVASDESLLYLTKEISVVLYDEVYIAKYPILYCDICYHTSTGSGGGEDCLLICGGDSGASFIGQPVYMMSLT